MLDPHEDIKKNEKDPKKKKHALLEIKDYLDLKYEFRKNKLSLNLEVRSINQESFRILDESFINSLWIELQLDGFKVSENVLLRILNSKLTDSYNPLEDYFNKLPFYDGKDYIGELANTIEIADMGTGELNLKDIWRIYLEKWLVGSVATVMGKGINQLCLILVSDQGMGKTTWLNRLCPNSMKEFLLCSHINPSLTDTNTANCLAEKWFVNIDDQLETIFGKDFNSMKAIITAPFVTNRKTWHRFTKKRKRICSFMGSVNSPEFLTDIENRRYLVFTTNKINIAHKVDMDKVWSQAYHLLEEGYEYWFSREEMKQLNLINEVYRQVSPEEEWLQKLYDPCSHQNPKAKFLMPSEILSKINAWSGMRLSIKKLSSAMRKLGYGKSISKRLEGNSRKVYPVIERTESDEQALQNKLKS